MSKEDLEMLLAQIEKTILSLQQASRETVNLKKMVADILRRMV